MYGGLNDWRPVFWFGFACCMATFLFCLVFMEESRYQRNLGEIVIDEVEMNSEQASTPQVEQDGSSSSKKHTHDGQGHVVEVAEVSPLAMETPTRRIKNTVRTENGVVVAVHADTERPIAKRVPITRLMRFAKPLPNAWPILWKGALQPILLLQLPSM